MQKTINLGNKKLKLVSSAATPILYNGAFAGDYFADLAKVLEMANKANEAEKGQEMNVILSMFSGGEAMLFFNFIWVYAKNADKNIPDLDEWLEDYEEMPVFDFLGDLIELMMQSVTTKKA